ncbi:MAG TPA: RNA 2',3'-cyclic phosphodiesterase [Terriglobales bacterium]|nr:RNA 2',3'-cyclic phosphodiesterase [Terriglobales bacterium]
MRLFIALDIDPAIRQRIATFVEGVRGFAPDVRFVGPESFHITLKFLGETEKLEAIRAALQGVQGPPIALNFRGYGFFPGPKNARVFWTGIEAGVELQELVSSVDRAMVPLGFEREKGPYRPHLTLARSGSGRPGKMRGDAPNGKFAGLQYKLSKLPEPGFGTMTAHEFYLYESKLSPRGSQYTKLASFPLG